MGQWKGTNDDLYNNKIFNLIGNERKKDENLTDFHRDLATLLKTRKLF